MRLNIHESKNGSDCSHSDCSCIDGNPITAPIVVYADESDTSTDQSVRQKNTGSGDSANYNCGQNLIKAGVGQQQCGNDGGEIIIGLPEVLVPTTEVFLPLPFP